MNEITAFGRHHQLSVRNQKIGLLLSERMEYGRGVMRGVANFAKDYPHWNFNVEEPTMAGLKKLKRWQPDGLIVMLNQKNLAQDVLALRKPIITVCKLPGVVDTFLVQSDDRMVGRLGAEHLLELGAAAYGYVGFGEGEYAKVRARAFAETIEKAAQSCILFSPLGKEPDARNIIALKNWLRRSPRPLALMTNNDSCGRLVLKICRSLNMQIPTEVAVLGVGNEDPLSRLVWPGLSSISLATDEIGRRAAAFLNKLLAGQALPKSPFFLAPLGVVARGSTRHQTLSDPLMAKVIAAIHQASAHPFSVEDLLKVVPLSRVSMERRFRRFLGRTPLQEIRRIRIAQAQQLLTTTNLPLKAIAERCGYSAASRLIESFQRETGQSPDNYRRGVLSCEAKT